MNQLHKELRAKAPAKLILSGEHAVVFGHPAIALAVTRYTEAEVKWSTPFHLSFQLLGIDFREQVTLEALKRLKQQLKHQYEAFSSGRIHIRDVIKHPFELALYTAMNVLDHLKRKLPMGLNVITDSNIPMGCGMGSSAACVVSLLYVLSQFLDIPFSLDDYLRLGIESENLQHGRSSGLDIQVIHQGGCMLYKNGQFTPRVLPQIPLQLILTGKPNTTTGECVIHAQPHFLKSSIGDDFAAITYALNTTLEKNDLPEIMRIVRENHRLLKAIEVGPEKVCAFIDEIEKYGGAAKICGAGAVQGDSAGVLWVIAEEPIVAKLLSKYKYNTIHVEGDAHGVRLI